MIQVLPGTQKWFWPGCHCSGDGTLAAPCAGHATPPPGFKAELSPYANPQSPSPWSFTFVRQIVPWTVNKVVACSPFKTRAPKPVMVKGGMALLDKKIELEELEVQLPNEDGRYFIGMKVLVRASDVVHTWAREVFTYEGIEFILVPESAIQVVKWMAPEQTVVSVNPDAAE